MWWRVLGVALVLLCVGVAGGYAVADRTDDGPARTDDLAPITAVSPAVPTTPAHQVLEDPASAPLVPDLPTHPEVLRLPRKGAGVIAEIPDGWRSSQNSATWTFVKDGNPTNTYGLRIQLLFGQRQSTSVVMGARIAALRQAQTDGTMFELEVTDQTDNSFDATYIDSGSYKRVTTERYVDFGGDMAYVVVAATGRVVDAEGLRDLVIRTANSLIQVHDGEVVPKP
jgi:hypothetical protein